MADVSSLPVTDWAGLMSSANLQNAQTGLTGQNAALVNQQAQAAQMQNQLTRARMPLIMQALSDYSDKSSNEGGVNGTPTASATQKSEAAQADESGIPPEKSWYQPAQIDSALRNRFFVPPVTSQEAQHIQRAALIGDPGLLEASKQQRELRVQQQSAASQYESNNLYDAMHSVSDADPGHALAQLAAIAPNAAKRIKAMIPDEADEDAAARAYASHVGSAVHQYTGREVVARPDGTYIDKTTGLPVHGVEKSGMTEEQWAGLAKAGNALVDVPDGQGHMIKVTQWQANKSPSLSAWVMQQASHAGVPGTHSTISGAPKAQARAAANKAAAAAEATQKAAGPAAQPGITTTANGQVDPMMSKALQDNEYRFQGPKTPAGATRSPDEQKAYDNNVGNAQALKSESDTATMAAGQAMTFLKAAQDILDSKGAHTGAYSKLIASAGRWVPGVNVPQTSNYQELAKYLGNAAIQTARATFPKLTQKEVFLQLEHLSPSPNMDEPAVRQMIKTGAGMAQYTLDSAKRVGAYLRMGNDPSRFRVWNQQYWPQEDIVNAAAPETKKASASAATKSYSEAQINKYAKVHFGGDVAKAKSFLGVK